MPSLSELSAVYQQQPYAPATGVNQQMGQGFSALGSAVQYAQENARQNAPISPWQRAIMRLMAGHDPKMVAADTKQQLGQGDMESPQSESAMPQDNSAMQQSAPPQAPSLGYRSYDPQQSIMGQSMQMPPSGPGYAIQTPQRDSANIRAIAGQGSGFDTSTSGMQRPPQSQIPRPQGLMGASQPQSGGADDMFAGMTNRDFPQAVAAFGQLGRMKNERDYMALEKQRGENMARVAEIGAGAKNEDTKAKEKMAEEKLAFEKEKEGHQVALRKEYLDILRNKASYYREIGLSKVGQDPKVKAAIERVKAAAAAYRALVSQPLNNMTTEGKNLEAEARLKWQQEEEALNEAVNSSKPTEKTGATIKVRYKGQRADLKGQEHTVTKEQWDATQNKADWEVVQ